MLSRNEQTQPNLQATLFQQSLFLCDILAYMDIYNYGFHGKEIQCLIQVKK